VLEQLREQEDLLHPMRSYLQEDEEAVVASVHPEAVFQDNECDIHSLESADEAVRSPPEGGQYQFGSDPAFFEIDKFVSSKIHFIDTIQTNLYYISLLKHIFQQE
jgi:hypothetical protein